jgi:hypothetical protein
MLGPTAGARVSVKLGRFFSVGIGPDLKAMILGSDVPEGSVVVAALLMGGVRASF